MSKSRLSSQRRAEIVAKHGEAYAAEFERGYNQQFEDARQAGVLAERARCEAIITSPEATGRELAARVVALETDLPADAARKLLAALPKDAEPDAPAAGAADWDDVVSDIAKERR